MRKLESKPLCIRTTNSHGYCSKCGRLLGSVKQVCKGNQEYSLNIPLTSGSSLPPRRIKRSRVKEVVRAREPDRAKLYPNIEVATLREVISRDRMFFVEPIDSPLRAGSVVWLKEKTDQRGCLARVTSVHILTDHKVFGFKSIDPWEIT